VVGLADLTLVLAVLAGVLGAVVGSFLNVVAARVPVGASVVRPRSACPRCGHEIRERDNIPVVSWLVLRGRCRDCAEPISARYPIVEAATAALFVATTLRFGVSAALPAFLLLAAVSVVLTVIDLDTLRLPDAIVLPTYPMAFVLGMLTVPGSGWAPMTRAVIGGVALLLCYGVLWFFTNGAGIGFGDVKLAGLLGGYAAWLGWGELVLAGFGAFVLGGVVGLALMATGKAGRRSAIPFGPFMFASMWIAVFAGEAIVDLYLSVVGLA
jgi:leader peptidase (prepilin peptidase)/N-methyltransferase